MKHFLFINGEEVLLQDMELHWGVQAFKTVEKFKQRWRKKRNPALPPRQDFIWSTNLTYL